MSLGDLLSDKQFDHFLLTRFNVRLKERASDDWLRHRLAYFESMCMPSVLGQTSDNFRWLVFFDADRDEWFEERVNALAAGAFEPIWVDGSLTPETTVRAVADRSSAEWVITTRLDNDDAIAQDFIDEIQERFEGLTTHFINFTSGLQLSDEGELYFRSDPSNAFISLVEKRAEMLGVYVDWHDRVSKYAPVHQVSVHPMWVQMVHGRNIGNAIRGIRADSRVLGEYFTVQLKASPLTTQELLLEQAKSTLSLAWRVARKPSRLVWFGKVLRARMTGAGRSR